MTILSAPVVRRSAWQRLWDDELTPAKTEVSITTVQERQTTERQQIREKGLTERARTTQEGLTKRAALDQQVVLWNGPRGVVLVMLALIGGIVTCIVLRLTFDYLTPDQCRASVYMMAPGDTLAHRCEVGTTITSVWVKEHERYQVLCNCTASTPVPTDAGGQ